MKRLIALGLALGAGLALAGTAQAQVKFGVTGPFTGANASFGAQLKNGADQAIEDINAAGGIMGKKITVTYGDGEKGEYRQRSLPVDAFAANAFGLHQVHGNIQEWVADCWRSTYQNAPSDGAASNAGDCGRRVLRGGSWYDGPQLLRAAARSAFYPAYRSNKIGFRVARSL